MQKLQFTRTPLALAAFLAMSVSAQAQTSADSAATDGAAIPVVIVRASADASAAGLSSAYAGGQVARGGRLGLLGNVSVMDAPFSSTNYTQALIEDQQAQSVADVLQNDPAVRVTRGFGNYQEMYVIRGFALNSDDLAYNGLFGLLPRQFVATELLERVEVFRGANTFINGGAPGSSGVGGAINLLPKRAAAEALTQVTVGVESGGQAYVATDIGRRFGPDNEVGVRVNAARRIGDTSVDAEQRSLSVLSVGVDYKGRGVRLSADAGYQDHKLTAARPSLSADATLALAVPEAPNSARNFGEKWTYSNERDSFGTARAEVDLAQDVVGWAALGARSGVEANTLGVANLTDNNGGASIYRFDNARKDTVRTGELGVRGKMLTGAVEHSVSATASSYWQDSRNAYALSNFAGVPTNIYHPVYSAAPAANYYTGGNLSNPLTTAKTILSSFAVADTMAFVKDTVLLTFGVRHQTIDSSSYDYNTGDNNQKYKESALTPMAGLVYKPIKNVSLYANYIEALQQGAVASGNGVTNIGQMFAPYKSKQKEIGIKYDAGTVGMSASLFTVAQPLAYVQNNVFGINGEQRNRGLELSFYGAPVRALRLLGGLTLLEAKQMSTFGGANNGKDAIGAPNTQANLGLEWDVAGVAGLTLTGRTVYTAQQYLDGGNTQTLPSWTRFDLGARYSTTIAEHSVTFRARIDNAADKSYWASAGGGSGYGYLVLAAPRTFALSATVAF